METTLPSQPKISLVEIIVISLSVFFLGIGILVVPWQYLSLVILCSIWLLILMVRLDWALLLIIFLMPITRIPLKTEYIKLLKYVLFASLLLYWMIKKVFSSDREAWSSVKNNIFNRFSVVFILFLSATLINSIDFNTSVKTLFMHMFTLAYLYIFSDLLYKKALLKKAVTLFLLEGAFVSLIAILQYMVVQYNFLTPLAQFILPAVQRRALTEGRLAFLSFAGYRSVGTLQHFNLLGIYLAMVFPLCISLFFYTREKVKRLGLICIAIMTVVASLASGSRGALLSLVISAIFLLIFYWKRFPKIIVISLLVLFLCVAAISSEQIKLFLRLSGGISSRDIIWRNAFAMFKEHPLLGSGLGTFPQQYLSRFGFPSLYDIEYVLNELTVTGSSEDVLMGFTAHNLFLNYAVETGIFSLALISLFYVIYFVAFSKFIRKKRNESNFYYALALGCAAIIAGTLVHSFFEATISFYHFAVSLPFIFIVSISIISFSKYQTNDGN